MIYCKKRLMIYCKKRLKDSKFIIQYILNTRQEEDTVACFIVYNMMLQSGVYHYDELNLRLASSFVLHLCKSQPEQWAPQRTPP